MPRRNLYVLVCVTLVAVLCHQRSRSGRITDTLGEAYQHIRRHYVEPVDRGELIDSALEGMIGALDEHSGYLRDYGTFKAGLDQEFTGVGIQVHIDRDTRQLTVGSPLFGSPAYNAGILAGDRILEVDGHSTQGITLAEAVGLIRGPIGSTIRLTVLHEGADEADKIPVQRATIEVDSVLGDLRGSGGQWNFFLEGTNRIGYLRVMEFKEKTYAELRSALYQLATQKVRGLVLDLRDNPGGLLTSAVGVSNLFIQEGEIVSIRERDDRRVRRYTAETKYWVTDLPLVVLINGRSASASEIVSACLQDHDRALVVGERTWGKASVQNVIRLDGGRRAMKLTTAHYTRPNGDNIHRGPQAGEDDQWGVRPNEGYEMVLTLDQRRRRVRVRRDRDIVRPAGAPSREPLDEPYLDTDPQLKRAVEYLEAQLAGESNSPDPTTASPE